MDKVNKDIRNQIVRYVIYLLLVIGLTILAFYFTTRNNLDNIWATLKHSNLWYIFAILGIVVICIICRSLVLFFLTRLFDKSYMFHRSIAIDQVSALYRMVTPAGVGGNFMGVFTFNKQGVRVSSALSIIAMYSIVYQIVLILYGLITIICKSHLIGEIGYIPISFGNSSPVNIPLWVLITIGFFFNVMTIGFILLISYWNGFFKFIRGPMVALLNKMHIIKDVEKSHNRLDEAVVNFRSNLKTLFHNIPVLLICALCFFIYITMSYSVPYFCGLSLGNASSNANFWDSVLLSNFHQMVTCIIPIPGSSVISEMFFLQLFYPANGPQFFDSENTARAALLLWRSLMFIIPLIIASLYTIIYRPRKRKYENNENQNIEE